MIKIIKWNENEKDRFGYCEICKKETKQVFNDIKKIDECVVCVSNRLLNKMFKEE